MPSAVDQFTVTNTTWASDVTERLIIGSGVLEQVVEVRRSEQVLASSSEEVQFLRSIKEGKVMGRRCPSCSKVYFPPRGGCPMCGVEFT